MAAMPNLDMAAFKQAMMDLYRDEEFTKVHEEINRKMYVNILERLHVLEADHNRLVHENEQLKKTVKQNENDIRKLKEQYDQRDKQSRKSNLRITGLKEVENENTKDYVTVFIKENMHLEVKPGDLLSAERIGLRKKQGKNRQQNRREMPRPILVKFNNHWTKREVFREKMQLKHLEVSENETRVFISEDLTPEMSEIFYNARQLVKSKRLCSAWTWEGQVYIKAHQHQQTGTPIKDLLTLAYYDSNPSNTSLHHSDRMRMELSHPSSSDSINTTVNTVNSHQSSAFTHSP